MTRATLLPLLGLLLLPAAASAAPRTVKSALALFGPAADARLRPHFDRAGVSFPPSRALLLGLKEERVLELWAQDTGGWRFIRAYDFTATSGGPGPKLRQGDLQIPEGLYRLEGLNPNSNFHLSMRVNYPNAEDRKQARAEGRTKLGGDIYIHGGAASIGCIAVGDEAIEELFTLIARVGVGKTRVLIAPHDLRDRAPPSDATAFSATTYEALMKELSALRRRP